MWFPTLWIYLVPFGNEPEFWKQSLFWIGLVFVTFPLNYLVYGLNDFNDVKADAVNERKGNFLFGAKFSKAQLQKIPLKIAIVIVPFIVYFSVPTNSKKEKLIDYFIDKDCNDHFHYVRVGNVNHFTFYFFFNENLTNSFTSIASIIGYFKSEYQIDLSTEDVYEEEE